ncbi:PPE domain-containing protein [Mycolicibacillus trivialis]
MLDPRWLGPPEIIAATFEVGPGPAATVANQVVWLTEAVNHEVMMGVSAANTAATSTQWIGLGGAASATAAAGLNAGLQTMIGWITHKIAVTQAAVEAYAVAASTVVPSAVCQANRDEWSVLNATNLLGFNTPAIVALDTEYFGEHYPHNSGIATVYAGVLSALTAALALPPPPALPTAAPAAPAAAGQALAETAATTADDLGTGAAASLAAPGAQPAAGVGDMGSMVGQLPQAAAGLVQPLQGVAEVPAKLAQTVLGPAQSLTGAFGALSGGMFPTATASPAAEITAAPAAEPGTLAETARGAPMPGAVGGYPLGATRYTQPTSSFAAENAGRPIGLKPDPAAVGTSATSPGRGFVGAPVVGGAPLARGACRDQSSGPDGAVAQAHVVLDRDR